MSLPTSPNTHSETWAEAFFTGDIASMSNPLLDVHPLATVRCRLDFEEEYKYTTFLKASLDEKK